MRYRFVHSQHAVAEALRLQRIAWRFLGALGLFLFTPARNKYGVAPARSLRAGGITVRETISEEQTRGSVRGDRRDSGGCEHGSREARRETAGGSTTGKPPFGLPAIHASDLNDLLPLALACFLLG